MALTLQGTWADGRAHLVFTRTELLARRVPLVPRSRVKFAALFSFHGGSRGLRSDTRNVLRLSGAGVYNVATTTPIACWIAAAHSAVSFGFFPFASFPAAFRVLPRTCFAWRRRRFAFFTV